MTTSQSFRRFPDRLVAWVAAGAIVIFAPDASGQTVTADEWHHGTTLAGFAGAASPSSSTNAAMGAAIGWEITPHFTLEGRGLWLDAGRNEDGFAALFGARVPLLPARPLVPFLTAGIGVYRTTYESIAGMTPRANQRRMMSGDALSWTFDDFAVALGGGVDLFLARHLALRPEFMVLLADRPERNVVPVFGVHLAYHFESHPITPAAR